MMGPKAGIIALSKGKRDSNTNLAQGGNPRSQLGGQARYG
jgi:hypothetical protein